MGWNPSADQSGWHQDGWHAAFDADAEYPTIHASRTIALPSGGVWIVDPDVDSFCEVDWSGSLPTGAALSSVQYTLPNGLTNTSARIDTDVGKSAIQVSGVSHGRTYQIAIVATLSDDSTIELTAPLRCFNG